MSQLVRLLRPALLALALLAPLQAQAFQITVSGVTYDLAVVNTTFNASATLLQSQQPWWTGTSDATLANTFANAFLSAGGDTGPDLSSASAFFAYSVIGSLTQAILVTGTTNLGFGNELTSIASSYVTATVVPAGPAAVPEIDGNAMAKALFVLFALWLWLQVRRGRGIAGSGAVG